MQRVAWRLLEALDAQLPPKGPPWVLLCPRAGIQPRFRHIQVRSVGPRGINLHLWEQAVLPWAARDGLLLSLIGSAPWFGGPLACLIHDAAVFDRPQAYTRAFAAWYRLLFRRIGHRAEHLFTVSEFSQGRLALHLRMPAPSIKVVPNGADHLAAVTPAPALLHKLGLDGRTFFLAVASANPAKNLPTLQAAFAQVAQRHDVHLVIAGGGNPRVYAEDGAANTHPRILRVGPVDDTTLRTLYGSAVALVFPSLYEGFGLPPAEAMACGCPVITSDLPPMRDVCGPAARYVTATDPVSIALGIETLLTQPAERRRLQAAGLERAATLTWQHAATQLLHELGQSPHTRAFIT